MDQQPNRTAKKTVQCRFCKNNFTNIARHETRCNPGGNQEERYLGRGVINRKHPTVKCQNCKWDFANIRRHEKLCKGPKVKINCPNFCGKTLIVFNMEKHLNGNSCKNKAKLEKCAICPVYADLENLRKHFATVHNRLTPAKVVEAIKKARQVKEDRVEARQVKEDRVEAGQIQNVSIVDADDEEFEEIERDFAEIDPDLSSTRNDREVLPIGVRPFNAPPTFNSRVYYKINNGPTVINNYNYPKGLEFNLQNLNDVCRLSKCRKCPLILKNPFQEHECIPD